MNTAEILVSLGVEDRLARKAKDPLADVNQVIYRVRPEPGDGQITATFDEIVTALGVKWDISADRADLGLYKSKVYPTRSQRIHLEVRRYNGQMVEALLQYYESEVSVENLYGKPQTVDPHPLNF